MPRKAHQLLCSAAVIVSFFFIAAVKAQDLPMPVSPVIDQEADGYIIDSHIFDFQIRQVKEGIWLADRPEFWRYPIVGNVVILEGDDEVMLFDGGRGIHSANQLISFVNEHIGKPIGYVALSHWHNDHTLGLQNYREAFPGVKFIAHEYTTNRIAETLVPQIETHPDYIDGIFESTRESLARANAGEEEISPQSRRVFEQALADEADIKHAYRTNNTVVPELSVPQGGSLIVDLGTRKVELKDIGVGNTDGDLIAWIEEEKILLGGDILTHPVPFGYPSKPRETAMTLERMLAYDFDMLIPGHGEILKDRTYGDEVLNVINWVNKEVDRMVADGASQSDIEAELKPQLEEIAKDFGNGNPMIEYRFNTWFTDPIVGRSYGEITETE